MDRRRLYPWDYDLDRQVSPSATRQAPPSPLGTQRKFAPAPRQQATPPKEDATRIFKHVPPDTVPTATRAVAEYAIRHALNLHGLPPSAVHLKWVQQLAPGATMMADDEFRAPAKMGGKTRSDGHDGRQLTITLRRDLSLQGAAEVGLHESYHACQFLRAPLAMRDGAVSRQVEQMAQEFATRHLRDLEWLIQSFQVKRRA